MSRRALFRTYIAFTDPTTTPTWTEVSADVRAWQWAYGRNQELGAIQTGQGVVTLDDSLHAYDPLLTSGPNGANVIPMRRIKIDGYWNRLTLNQASIETDTTGWAAGANTTIARSTAQASDGAASLRLTSSAAGEVSAVATSVPCEAGEPIVGMASFRAAVSARSCRVDLRWLNAAGGTISTTTGSTVTSSTSGWTQATTTAVAPERAEAVQLIVAVQATGAGSEQHYADKMGVYPADGGTPTWSRGGPEPKLSGYLPTWEPMYGSVHGGEITLPIHCALGVLAGWRLPESAYSVQVKADSPTVWWRLGDTGATMRDSAGGFDGTYVGSSSTGSLVRSSTNAARSFASDATTVARSAFIGAPITGTTFTIEAWLSTDASVRWIEQGAPAVATAPAMFATISPTQVAFRFDGGPAAVNRLVTVVKSGLSLSAGAHHVVLTRSGSTFALYIDGADVSATVTLGGAWTGAETDFGTGGSVGNVTPADADLVVDEVAIYSTALSAARVLAHYQAGLGWPGIDEGDAITQVLDDIGWPIADRDIGSGASIVQVPAYSGGNALALLQQLTKSGQGRLYTSPAGLLTYRSRWWSITNPSSATSQATFGDGAGELPHAEVRPLADASRIINRVVAQRVGGELIEIEGTTATRFFERSESVTDLLYTTDLEVVDFANWRLDRYGDSQVDVRAVVLDPTGSSDALELWPQIMQRQLGDRITVRKRMVDGSLILGAEFLIEQIVDTNVSKTSHRTVLAVSRAETRTYLVLDDVALGQLDTARLAF